MYSLIESICVLDGKARNLEYHQKRMDESVSNLYGIQNSLNLNKLISEMDFPAQGKYKLRLVYSDKIDSTELIPYTQPSVNSFQLVEDNEIEYNFKKEDRSDLLRLKNQTAADEIIIVKNGLITDTSISNLVFYDGTRLFTPAKPLLRGVMRCRLLALEKLIEKDISPENLNEFKSFKPINAMLDLNESQWTDMAAIQK